MKFNPKPPVTPAPVLSGPKRVVAPCGLWVFPDHHDGFVHIGTISIPDGMALLAWHVDEECPERARLN